MVFSSAIVKNLAILLRPRQWLKNIIIFLPLFFSGKMFDTAAVVLPLAAAFIAFTLAASGVYCLNDIIDAEADRLHPQKRFRPIAAGAVSPAAGRIIAVSCWLASTLVCITLLPKPMTVLSIIAAYVIMNIAYSFKLKQYAIIDVFVIALGFVLRVICGGEAAGIELSHWIVLMTFLLALFLAFAKRRDDVIMYQTTGTSVRQNIKSYSLAFMDQVTAIVATITIVCYIMYSVSPELMQRLDSQYVYLTSIFVIAAIIRYLQLTIVDSKSGSPTEVLIKDRFIQSCILLWGISFYAIIYL